MNDQKPALQPIPRGVADYFLEGRLGFEKLEMTRLLTREGVRSVPDVDVAVFRQDGSEAGSWNPTTTPRCRSSTESI